MERSSSRVRTRVIRAYSHASPYPCVSLGPERDSGHRHPSSTQNDVLLSIVPPPSLRCRRLLRTAERRAGLSRLQRGNGVSGAGVGRGGGGVSRDGRTRGGGVEEWTRGNAQLALPRRPSRPLQVVARSLTQVAIGGSLEVGRA